MKKVLIIVLIVILTLCIAFCIVYVLSGFHKHRWGVDNLSIAVSETDRDILEISGCRRPDSARHYYAGYKVKQNGGDMVIEIYYRYFSTKSKEMDFTFQVPLDESVERVIIAGRKSKFDALAFTKEEGVLKQPIWLTSWQIDSEAGDNLTTMQNSSAIEFQYELKNDYTEVRIITN